MKSATKHRICTYGNPVLRRKAETVSAVDDSIRKLAADMIEVMHATNGVGLAAQQIGKHIRLCVVNLPPEHDTAEGVRMNPDIEMPIVLLNPDIVEKSGVQTAKEACLSIPDVSAPVNRALEITITFMDLDGKQQRLEINGFLARVIQHEIDHLNGMLFMDRVSPMKKIALSGRLKQLKKKTETDLGIS